MVALDCEAGTSTGDGAPTTQASIEKASNRQRFDQIATWPPIGTPAFITDGGTIDRGRLARLDVAKIGAASFVGTDVDDLVVSGNYRGTSDGTLLITDRLTDSLSPPSSVPSLSQGLIAKITGRPMRRRKVRRVVGRISS